ncbi:nitroreductase/quinone reductase family protein [Flexivirga sp. B27]
MSEQPRAQTLRFQGAVNRVMRAMLRTPVLGKLPGRRLVLLEIVGRRSGREFEVPVAYTRQGNDLLIGTPFGWGRNLRTGDVIDIVLMGSHRRADVVTYADHNGVIDAYDAMCRDNRAFANFNKVSIDKQGRPDPDDLEAAFRAGARAFRLTPRP